MCSESDCAMNNIVSSHPKGDITIVTIAGQSVNDPLGGGNKQRLQRGAQAVEFALVFPFLAIILLLVIDFGILAFNKAVITNASREAARAGTVLSATPWSTTSVSASACNYAKTLLISTASGTRTTTCTGTADPVIVVSNPGGEVPPPFNTPITVTITYNYQGLLTPLTTFLLSVPIWRLTAASTMTHE